MASHLYVEIQFICISFFAIMLWRLMRIDDKRTSQLYLRMLVSSAIAWFAFDLAQAIVGGVNPQQTGLRYFLNIMYYLALGSASYCWFLYSESEQDSRLASDRRLARLCSIPFALLALLTVTTPATHWLFYFDESGAYVRGAGHFVQVIICGVYMLATSIKAYWLASKAKDTTSRNHLLITGSLIIPTAITAVLQVIWPMLPILCAGCCDSLLFCFLAMQEQNISVDPLTKVNNRRRMVQNLESLIDHAREDYKPFGLFIIDVDKFKGINDTYGHVEGDNALVHIAQAISTLPEPGLQTYRYGGDEFVMTSELCNDETLERIAHEIKEAVAAESAAMNKPYELSVSVGYTRFELHDADPDDIVSRADSQLYEQKRARAVAVA